MPLSAKPFDLHLPRADPLEDYTGLALERSGLFTIASFRETIPEPDEYEGLQLHPQYLPMAWVLGKEQYDDQRLGSLVRSSARAYRSEALPPLIGLACCRESSRGTPVVSRLERRSAALALVGICALARQDNMGLMPDELEHFLARYATGLRHEIAGRQDLGDDVTNLARQVADDVIDRKDLIKFMSAALALPGGEGADLEPRSVNTTPTAPDPGEPLDTAIGEGGTTAESPTAVPVQVTGETKKIGRHRYRIVWLNGFETQIPKKEAAVFEDWKSGKTPEKSAQNRLKKRLRDKNLPDDPSGLVISLD